MKKINLITTAAAFIIAFAGIAQNSNNLIVFSETGEKFYLVLNGLKYNQEPQTNVRVTNLPAPNYKAVIIFANGQEQFNANVYLMWGGEVITNKEFTYGIAYKDGKYKLKMVSQSDIGGQNPYAANCVSYNPNGTMINATAGNVGGSVSTQVTTTEVTTTMPNNVNINVNGLGMNVNTTGMVGSTTVTSYTTTTTTSNYGGNATYQDPPPPTNGGGCMPMSEHNFGDLMNSVNSQSFEDSKLKIAQQALSSNCVRAEQVKRLMGLFTFEDNKLALAKYAYDFTVDRNNYFKLNDAFTYSSSVDALNNYINSRR